MIIKYATKRDTYGNRHFIALDTDKKIFARTPQEFILTDFIEIKQKDYYKILEEVENLDFVEWYRLDKQYVGSY